MAEYEEAIRPFLPVSQIARWIGATRASRAPNSNTKPHALPRKRQRRRTHEASFRGEGKVGKVYSMSAAIQEHLTLEEFHAFERSRTDGPRYEYWFGKAVPKATPTWLHATLQALLIELLAQLGYKTGGELELRILPAWHPKPDVVAATFREQPYPTRPIEIVAEVLSPADEPGEIHQKCQLYEKSGIGQIYVFDPEKQIAQRWHQQLDRLVAIEALALPNGVVYPVAEIWAELDRRMA